MAMDRGPLHQQLIIRIFITNLQQSQDRQIFITILQQM